MVNAAGPWSGGLNRLAGVGSDFTIGVRPLREEVHQIAAPDSSTTGLTAGPTIGPTADSTVGSGSLPVVADVDLGTYLRPAAGGRLLIGGTQPDCDPAEWIDDPDEADPRPTAHHFRTQVTRAARRFPGITVPNRPVGVAGVYDAADDWTPIYDRTALDGYYVAMGTSGNQFKNAPLVGRYLATLIDLVEAGHDHDGDPIRYRCEHTGNVVDLGAFSRRRPVRSGSARTVMG